VLSALEAFVLGVWRTQEQDKGLVC
jgi:hypothetical protein